MYHSGTKNWLKHLDFMVLDAFCLEFALVMAYILRHGFGWPFSNERYAKLGGIILLLHICVVFFLNSYHQIINRGYLVETKMVMKHNFSLLLALLLYLYVTKQGEVYSRMIVFTMCILSCVIMVVVRLGWKRILRKRRRAQRTKRNILIITTSGEAKTIAEVFHREYYADFQLLGMVLVDQDRMGRDISSIPIVATKENVLQYVKNHIVDEVLISIPDDSDYTSRMVNHLINMGVTVHINLIQLKDNMTNSVVERFCKFTVLSVGINVASEWQLAVKRLIDICGSLLGLMITGILFLIFAPIIYVQSPGPVLFVQDRIGKNGRKFKIYKFRSMYLDAEERKKELLSQNEMKGQMFKMENDPRIIPIGNYMRKRSLDEFPQFWNVLKGEMSLVGTRPPTVEEYEQYELHHKKRLAAKPGITGLWQVSGRSKISDFEEVVALDAQYITNWSLSLDIKILFKTIQVIWKHEGAL